MWCPEDPYGQLDLVEADRLMENEAIPVLGVRPAAFGPNQNFSDSWFESSGSLLRGRGSMPSGHTIVAFGIATVVARRYGNHRWVPYVSYGAAALVGFSRVTLSAHFISDVFLGGALGYSIGR